MTVWGRPQTATAPERQAQGTTKQPTTEPQDKEFLANQPLLAYNHTPKGTI